MSKKKNQEQAQKPNKGLELAGAKWRDSNGTLVKLARNDFGDSFQGRTAHYDYQIERIRDRKARFVKRQDPGAKKRVRLQNRLDRAVERAAQIKEELNALTT